MLPTPKRPIKKTKRRLPKNQKQAKLAKVTRTKARTPMAKATARKTTTTTQTIPTHHQDLSENSLPTTNSSTTSTLLSFLIHSYALASTASYSIFLTSAESPLT